ncbi:hypothetical protein A2276_01350 [candidate division WOR-1 bacterium RIFOXYA12_FULL_43_27]|uniref:Uncharacterized protein n=1 Tax=candidate division WOR-1 bacterium RIFOXYC2_FULL_46_14 TaxID=1802587 RepID=A0A1F4U5A4_UNCSA|nr:MAG: hypothetical protein A2276_01350 [candidate division WOR-1 bacterium RIFOXYA12_FULL_43_27]OGC20668.1 MAG: hypothetical protein A2292_06525 [candidate division WOR-1 bacterium RIFOXYB2_FULL_46_45]OGC31595.1 MAG: hypothetical protein A2232_04925 [candidate division WOR-1 bacterium RIFOXYA2_FULL_46_56]OGC40000.1 MAG: hypothetical protein A2438_05770 [candidate division WOR-1 bacterium RIFOXYC2_FULL_46_14]
MYRVPNLIYSTTVGAQQNKKSWEQILPGNVIVGDRTFGKSLPVENRDRIAVYCMNGGKTFLGFASRRDLPDCSWFASDLCENRVAYVKKMLSDPKFRFSQIIREVELCWKKVDGRENTELIRQELADDALFLKDRAISITTQDANDIDPLKTVDWSFSAEHVLYSGIPFILGMMATSKKGIIFATSFGVRFESDYEMLYRIAQKYGHTITFQSANERCLYGSDFYDSGVGFIGQSSRIYYALIAGYSFNASFDWKLLVFLKEYMNKGAITIDASRLGDELSTSPYNIKEALERIDGIYALPCRWRLSDDSPYLNLTLLQ